MSLTSFNFERACKIAGIKVYTSKNTLAIRTLYDPFSKSGFGSLLFLLGGVTTGVLSVTHAKDHFTNIIGSLLGFALSILAILSIFSELTSYVKISKEGLKCRNKFKQKSIKISRNHRVKMKTRTEFVQLKSQPGSGSHFTIVELYIANETDQQLMIEFQTEEKYSTMANHLGGILASMIKQKLIDN